MNTENAIDFPPLPIPGSVSISNSDPGSVELRDNFTAQQMRDFVEADRAQRQTGQEPAAWMTEWTGPEGKQWFHAHASEVPAVDEAHQMRGTCTPLYASPRPSAVEPLTTEQIDNIIKVHTGGFIGGMHFVHLARAIEQAHGITATQGATR